MQADNIVLAEGVTWTSANTLALDAYRSIAIVRPVSVDGDGGLNLITNNGGTGPGSLTFGKKGHVVFSSLTSILAINGADYTLVGDIETLASDIAAKPSGNFALAADYDARMDGTYSTSPIGKTLSGNFEGLGNAIRNLSLHDFKFEYIGLFAALEGGRISDIGVINADIASSNGSHGSGYAVGVLLGYANGAVGGSYSSGTVSGVTSAVGGLIGIVGPAGSVDHSGSAASVAIANGSAVIAAGLVGQNDGMITHAYATGLDFGCRRRRRVRGTGQPQRRNHRNLFRLRHNRRWDVCRLWRTCRLEPSGQQHREFLCHRQFELQRHGRFGGRIRVREFGYDPAMLFHRIGKRSGRGGIRGLPERWGADAEGLLGHDQQRNKYRRV